MVFADDSASCPTSFKTLIGMVECLMAVLAAAKLEIKWEVAIFRSMDTAHTINRSPKRISRCFCSNMSWGYASVRAVNPKPMPGSRPLPELSMPTGTS